MPSAGIAAVLIGITIATVFYYFFGGSEEEPPAHNVGRRSNSSNSIRGRRANNWDTTISGTCSICLEPLTMAARVILDPCHHIFHEKCISEWIIAANEPSCPNCRCTFR
ncbi:E3 ubiquitin-protein ligase RNF103 isoform X2 [Halictus rubicundus]|uniref:E3 ubiquitin-protein ligase RNF103 isoform X2 n=1 Tax=Halictus rubicundus TaxID=77578 RepID=UPI004036557D